MHRPGVSQGFRRQIQISQLLLWHLQFPALQQLPIPPLGPQARKTAAFPSSSHCSPEGLGMPHGKRVSTGLSLLL
jgi:hypothetical protein